MNGIENPDTETLVECIPTMEPIDVEIAEICITDAAATIEVFRWGRTIKVPVQPEFARLFTIGDTVRITVEHIPTEPESEPEPESEDHDEYGNPDHAN